MMFGMERRRAGGTVSSMFTALFAFSIVLNLLAQVGARAADPASQLGSLVVDAVVGVTFAVCALVARKLSAFRSGWVMLAGSVLWTFGTLATAIDAISGAWAVLWALQGATDVIVIWLALGYPTGRLPTWWARSVVAAAALLYSFVAVTRLFLDDPGRWGTCDCVPNPVAVLGTERIYGTIEPVAVWGNLTIAAVALIAVIVRWVRGSAPWRAVNVLMTAVFAILVVVWITFDARWLLPMEWDGTGAVLLRSGAMTAIPVAYVAGLASLRSTRARVADLILATRDWIDHPRWQHLLREALGDRTVRVIWWDREACVCRDATGERVADPRAAGTGMGASRVLEVGSHDDPIAWLVHDPVLGESHELLDSIVETMRLTSENEQLTADLEATLVQVRDSRERLVTAGDEARRRIEHDLHDGAQQLLVSTAISLRLSSARAQALNDPSLDDALAEASRQLSTAIGELRALARGIAPGTGDGDVADVLEELALRSPLPTIVRIRGVRALDAIVRSTIYFVVAECLTNVVRHAEADSTVVELDLGQDPVRLNVIDDGGGGASMAGGTGLRGIADRVEAIGGTLDIDSTRLGTSIRVALPVHGASERALVHPAGMAPRAPNRRLTASDLTAASAIVSKSSERG